MIKDQIDILFPPVESIDDLECANIVKLVNDVYDKAESDMWRQDGSRTNVAEINKMIKDEKLVLAKQGNIVIGSIAVQIMEDTEICEFGMLTVDQQFRKTKVGSRLISFAEDWANQHGCTRMRLELLTPRNWNHPSKEFLKKWYRKIGYRPTKTEPFELLHPDKIDDLATECDFTVWIKPLY